MKSLSFLPSHRCVGARLIFSLLILVAATSARAGVFTINAWTNDASSGIVPGQTVWAYHFGVTNHAQVNGVTVPGIGTNGNPTVAGQLTVTNIPQVFLNDDNNLVSLGGNGSAVMARNFIYSGSPGRITVRGLESGEAYTISFYGVGFEAPPTTRAVYFTNGADTVYVDENALGLDKGVRVDYTFTGGGSTNQTIVMPTNASTFHLYGVALRRPLLVTTNTDAGPGSLRQAILDAAVLGGGNISFATNLSGKTILLSGPLDVNTTLLTIRATDLPGGIRIDGNQAGSVFSVTGGLLQLVALTITNGLGLNGGGGIYNTANVYLQECTLTGNSTPNYGGGILSVGTLSVYQCTFSGNSCLSDGGGAIDSAGTLTVNQCTVSGNSAAGSGGGIYVAAGTLDLKNSIVAGNSPGDIANFGVIITNGVNFLAGDPVLAPLGNYGGRAPTRPPLPGSPVIEACLSGSDFASDQRGVLIPIGHYVDIGAVEADWTNVVVTTVADSGPNSLRDVIDYFPAGTAITFAANLSGKNILLSGPLVVDQDLTIDASGLPGGIRIDGNQLGSVFYVLNCNVVMTGLTITNGLGLNGAGGGGIYDATASLTLNRCTLVGNSTPSRGGGIKSFDSTLTLNQCTLTGNSCTLDGGAAIDCAGFTSPSINQSTVSGNFTTNSYGTGGMANSVSFATLKNSIVAGNSAPVNTNFSGLFAFDGANLTTGNPGLAPLGNYGGPTPTMAVRPGSPALNASLSSTFTTDQRGQPAVGTRDIGAYEAGSPSNYLAWAWETLPLIATAPQHAAGFDFDGDGRLNVIEYATLTDPAVGNTGTMMTLTVSPGATNRTATFGCRLGNSDLAYRLDYGYTVTSWVNILKIGGIEGDHFQDRALTLSTNGNVLTVVDSYQKPDQGYYHLKIQYQP